MSNQIVSVDKIEKTLENNKKENLKEKQVNKDVKPIIEDIFKYAPSKFIGLLLNLIVVPIYTSLLTPSQYGLYSISIATLSFLCIIFSDWIGISGLRFFREQQLQNKSSDYHGTLISILLINLSVMFTVTLICKSLICDFFNIPEKYLYVILILILPISLRALLFQILRAQIKPIAYSITVILNQVLTMMFACFFIMKFNLKANAILLSMAIVASIIGFILAFQTKFFKTIKFDHLSFVLLKKLCFYGMPLAIGHLSMWIITQSNKFILQHYKGSFYNGISGVAYNLTYSLLLSLLSVFIIAAMPRIIRLYENGSDVRPVISKLSGYLICISLPLIGLISIYANDFVSLMSNEKFAQASILIPFLAMSIFFIELAEFTTIQYHLVNKTYIDTIIKFSIGVLGIVLNIILIPKIGLVAIGITALAVNILYFILSLVISMENLQWIMPVKEIGIGFLCCIPTVLAMICLKYLNIDGIWQMLILLCIYYILYYVINKNLKKIEVIIKMYKRKYL